MKKNFTSQGRFIRAVLGIVLLLTAFLHLFQDFLLQNLAIGVGLILLVTAILQFCPIYKFLGIDTFKANKRPKMY